MQTLNKLSGFFGPNLDKILGKAQIQREVVDSYTVKYTVSPNEGRYKTTDKWARKQISTVLDDIVSRKKRFGDKAQEYLVTLASGEKLSDYTDSTHSSRSTEQAYYLLRDAQEWAEDRISLSFYSKCLGALAGAGVGIDFMVGAAYRAGKIGLSIANGGTGGAPTGFWWWFFYWPGSGDPDDPYPGWDSGGDDGGGDDGGGDGGDGGDGGGDGGGGDGGGDGDSSTAAGPGLTHHATTQLSAATGNANPYLSNLAHFAGSTDMGLIAGAAILCASSYYLYRLAKNGTDKDERLKALSKLSVQEMDTSLKRLKFSDEATS